MSQDLSSDQHHRPDDGNNNNKKKNEQDEKILLPSEAVLKIRDYYTKLLDLCFGDNDGRLCTYRKLVVILIALTFLLIPLNIFVNIFLSYRLDPGAFYSKHSNYQYKKKYEGIILVLWWIHKVGTIVWSAAAITQVLMITLYGTKGIPFQHTKSTRKMTPEQERDSFVVGNFRFFRPWLRRADEKMPSNPVKGASKIHMFLGITLTLSSMIAAVCGFIVMQQHDARYDNFTQVFFVIAFGVTSLCSSMIFIERIIWRLGVSDKWKQKIVEWFEGPNAKIVYVADFHAFFGYMLTLPILSMMIQFIVYSFILLIEGKPDGQEDYRAWRISMYVCMSVGTLMTFLFTLHAFLMTRYRNPKYRHQSASLSSTEQVHVETSMIKPNENTPLITNNNNNNNVLMISESSTSSSDIVDIKSAFANIEEGVTARR